MRLVSQQWWTSGGQRAAAHGHNAHRRRDRPSHQSRQTRRDASVRKRVQRRSNRRDHSLHPQSEGRRGTEVRLLRLCCACAMVAVITMPSSARTLAEVQARGAISLCANPDALPYASNQSDKPGFQIEIARALAEALGVKLQLDWIVPRMRAGLVDCDMLLDTIIDPDLARGPVKVSEAYQRSGVALALAPRSEGIQRFSDIAPGKRVGVMVNSVASKLLNQRGIYTVPYAFESEMIADLVKGDLDACAVSPATIAYYVHAHPGSGLRYVHAYDAES